MHNGNNIVSFEELISFFLSDLVYVKDGNDPKTNFSLDLKMSNTEYGFLNTAFTIINSISCVAMGYQADKFNRKYLLVSCGIIWNLISMSAYYVTTY